MSSDWRISELAEIYQKNRRKFEQLERYIRRKENRRRYGGRESTETSGSIIDLGNDIMARLISIKTRIHKVATSISAMKKIADSLHSKYTMEIVPIRIEHDTSIKDMIESKLTKLQQQNEALNTAISRLAEVHGQLVDRKTNLDERIMQLQMITKAPVDDLQLIEELVGEIEMEDDALFIHVNQPEDVDINVDGIVMEQELRSKTQMRRMMIEKRRQEIRQEMEELANKVYSVHEATRVSFHSEEPSYNSEIVERYRCFADKQEELDREEMEINERIAAHSEERKRMEQAFEEKLATLSKITDENVERDHLMFQIHEMNDRTITLKETRLVLSDNLRRLKRNEAMVQSMKLSNEQAKMDIARMKERVHDKQAEIERNTAALMRKRQLIEKFSDGVDALAEQYEERERMVNAMEMQEKNLEYRCDQLSQDIKMEADQFDCLLFEASLSRADSRLQRFQALLDTRTESQHGPVVDSDDSESSEELTDLLRQASLVVQTPTKFDNNDSLEFA